eukprot:6206038-Pleurochrysis_carterae.AAC.3
MSILPFGCHAHAVKPRPTCTKTRMDALAPGLVPTSTAASGRLELTTCGCHALLASLPHLLYTSTNGLTRGDVTRRLRPRLLNTLPPTQHSRPAPALFIPEFG